MMERKVIAVITGTTFYDYEKSRNLCHFVVFPHWGIGKWGFKNTRPSYTLAIL